MKKLIMLAVLLIARTVTAAEIVLVDGTRLQGEVISLQAGVYEIRSDTLGTVRLPNSKVQSISNQASGKDLSVGPAAAGAQTAMQRQTLESVQQNLMNSPGLMNSIMSLQNTAEMQAVLNDPEIMRAVQQMDFAALQNHPKIKALMNNREVRSITGEVAR